MKKFSELPVEIQEQMLTEQVNQGNKKDASVFEGDASVFEGDIYKGKEYGGFIWEETKLGWHGWCQTIIEGNYALFYEMYPKNTVSPYPKVMWVSDCADFSEKQKRVVFMEKCGKFISWVNVTTLEEAEKVTHTNAWDFAKDIEPVVKLTKQEIAEKFRIDINNLEIEL